MRDPADLARVDVWDESGTRLLGLHPYGAAIPVQWVGWSKQGRLLTLGDGKLTAWEVPAGKAVFEVAGDYRLPVAPVRGRSWLAAVGGNNVDLLETDTGRCLGRLPLTGAELPDTYPDLSVSRDGKLLAYCGRRTDESPSQLTPHRAAVLLAWDLTTGKAHEPLQIMREPGWSIVALDEHRVFVPGQVIDLRCRVPVARYSCICLPDSPDGQLWSIGPDPADEGKPPKPWFKQPGQAWNPANDPRGALRPVELVAYDTGPASPQELFTPQTPLTVEADLRKTERSQTLAKEQVTMLQKNGYTIGKSPWRLRADAEVFDSQSRFTNGEPIPAVRFTWRLFTPEGTETWKHSRNILFADVGGKYGVSEEVIREAKPFEEGLILEKYDFGGRNPREVLVEDMLDKAMNFRTIEMFPRQTGKFNGRYQELPAQGEVRFPPMTQ